MLVLVWLPTNMAQQLRILIKVGLTREGKRRGGKGSQRRTKEGVVELVEGKG